MASMLRDVAGGEQGVPPVNVDALKSEVRAALISLKANASPMAMRIAWHASGTFNRFDNTGGCNGATMRFEPERSDPDNAGLSIIRDLLHHVKQAHPEISHADLWAFAGVVAIEFLGGPPIPFNFGRTDDATSARCPANGRLPDASKGADHLREVFGRMGFNDQEIVALSGAHTLGRCHLVRSGFDGPWTTKPLAFDNEYFVNLVERTWKPRKWDGNFQFEDDESGKLMMLPTDIALVTDPKFRPYVELYAKSQDAWFRDFAKAYAKLLALGCPTAAQPTFKKRDESSKEKAAAEFRELAMHGSVLPARRLYEKGVDVHGLESTSDRSALHKAAFWGHIQMVRFLVRDAKLAMDVQDKAGDTPLHDAARFGHAAVAAELVACGASTALVNAAGQTAAEVADDHGYTEVAAIIRAGKPRSKL